MSENDIKYIVEEALKAQRKQSTNWQSWLKLIIMVVFVPILTVYSSFRVIEWRVQQIEISVEKISTTYVDQCWYERYIIAQKELIERIEENIEKGDKKLELQILEVKKYLDELVKEKKLYKREFNT